MNLKKIIALGESQTLDFKHSISDSGKIARTLSAFSNTDGGTLLIGVRDNGSVAGVKSEEEFYMIETAATHFCTPEVKVTVRQHFIDGKSVLEVIVPRGESRIYRARDEEGKWRTYFRKGDQNLVANRIITGVWRKQDGKQGVMIRFGKPERILLDYLKQNGLISFNAFRKIASLPSHRAEKIIISLVVAGVIEIVPTPSGYRFAAVTKEP